MWSKEKGDTCDTCKTTCCEWGRFWASLAAPWRLLWTSARVWSFVFSSQAHVPEEGIEAWLKDFSDMVRDLDCNRWGKNETEVRDKQVLFRQISCAEILIYINAMDEQVQPYTHSSIYCIYYFNFLSFMPLTTTGSTETLAGGFRALKYSDINVARHTTPWCNLLPYLRFWQ